MRRKNRQVKMTLDIPEGYNSDDEFMQALMYVLDNMEWHLNLLSDGTAATVNRVQLGDVVIEPEDEEA